MMTSLFVWNVPKSVMWHIHNTSSCALNFQAPSKIKLHMKKSAGRKSVVCNRTSHVTWTHLSQPQWMSGWFDECLTLQITVTDEYLPELLHDYQGCRNTGSNSTVAGHWHLAWKVWTSICELDNVFVMLMSVWGLMCEVLQIVPVSYNINMKTLEGTKTSQSGHLISSIHVCCYKVPILRSTCQESCSPYSS